MCDLIDMNTDDLAPDPDFVAEAIACALDKVKPLGGSAELYQLFEDIAAGKLRTLKWPWQNLLECTKATKPGTVTVICGDPNSSKSLWLLELFVYWHVEGHKIALYELEETRVWHKRRLLALVDGDNEILDDDNAERNHLRMKAAMKRHEALIDSIDSRIFDNENDSITLSQIGDWVEEKAIQGCACIGIDPVTAAKMGKMPWDEDREFLMRVKRIAAKYDTRIFLVTHPKTGSTHDGKGGIMSGLAGGAAYSRFPQTILWLNRPDQPEMVTVVNPETGLRVKHEVECNRWFKVLKARNGAGFGNKIAMDFDGKTLRMKELGVIVKGQQ